MSGPLGKKVLRCIGRYWHKADIRCAANFVRFRTTTDKGGFWPAMVCPLMTVLVALLRDFGAVQQMPSVAKRARCLADGLLARPA